MPLNAGPEFFEKRKKDEDAKTTRDKIKALEEMLSAAPTHKGAESLRADLKRKISRLKEASTKKKAGGSRGDKYSVKKEGDAQIVLVGYPNSGKSTLLSKITHATPEIAPYPYTTSSPEVGTLDYGGVKLQVIEIPALMKGSYYSDRMPWFGTLRNSDGLVLVVENQVQLKGLLDELEVAKIRNMPVVVAVTKEGDVEHSEYPVVRAGEPDWVEKLKGKVWEKLGRTKVYTRKKGRVEARPMVLRGEPTVRKFAEGIHKDFLKNFRFARVWRKGWAHSGEKVGLDFRLKEDDIVEVYA